MKQSQMRAVILSWIGMFAAVSALAIVVGFPSEVTISESGSYRTISSNGIPDHEVGKFPNRNNPNAITPQNHRFRVPLNPRSALKSTAVGMNLFGVALNGVPFDPAAAEWFDRNPDSGWQYEALSGFLDLGMDFNNAHVQPGGVYHYHGIPDRSLESHHGNDMSLTGYAADGFPIYARFGYRIADNSDSGVTRLRSSYRLKQGTRPGGPGGRYDGTFVEDWEYVPGSGDLDECNGRFGATPEYPNGTYYYVLTDSFPFIPRLWRGTPDPSFFKRRPRPGASGPAGGPPSRGHRPPPRLGPPPR